MVGLDRLDMDEPGYKYGPIYYDVNFYRVDVLSGEDAKHVYTGRAQHLMNAEDFAEIAQFLPGAEDFLAYREDPGAFLLANGFTLDELEWMGEWVEVVNDRGTVDLIWQPGFPSIEYYYFANGYEGDIFEELHFSTEGNKMWDNYQKPPLFGSMITIPSTVDVIVNDGQEGVYGIIVSDSEVTLWGDPGSI